MHSRSVVLVLLALGLGLLGACTDDVPSSNTANEGEDASPDPMDEPDGEDQPDGGEAPDVPDCEPSDEVCDGLDNDCDGLIDEGDDGEPLVEACYVGPEGTEGVGACSAGVRACDAGVFGACEGQSLPGDEVCDELDNNCDGVIDEGFNTGDACEVGVGECRGEGVFACTEDGLDTACDAVEGAPREEVCDGLDNDCDGFEDESEENGPLVVDCYEGPENTEGFGPCQAGTQVCENGLLGTCEGQQLPEEDLCDGLDNDCDEGIDEDFELGGSCEVGQGACRGEGVFVCALNRRETVCDAVEGESSDEVCDNEDNDCDGEIDEGENGEPLIQDCYDGPEDTVNNGICLPGEQACINGEPGPCIGQQLPETEVCDGVDNDCNGRRDELEICGGGELCSNGSIDDCNPEGATLSEGGAFVDPQPPVGFVQCAGFRNTTEDDVRFDWENNCFGHEARLRLRGWNDETDELLWDTTMEAISDALFTQLDSGGTNHAGSEGLHICENEVPNNSCGITLWRLPDNGNPCGCSHESGLVRCADIFAGNAANDKVIYVGAEAAPDNEVFIAPPGGKNTCTLNDPVLKRVRVAIYEQAP